LLQDTDGVRRFSRALELIDQAGRHADDRIGAAILTRIGNLLCGTRALSGQRAPAGAGLLLFLVTSFEIVSGSFSMSSANC
jgi:hypothetical protein